MACILLTRRGRPNNADLIQRLDLLDRAHERAERNVRDEMALGREENARAAKSQREEVSAAMQSLGESNLKSILELGTILKGQFETVSKQTGKLTESNEARLDNL